MWILLNVQVVDIVRCGVHLRMKMSLVHRFLGYLLLRTINWASTIRLYAFSVNPAPCVDACPTGALRKNEHSVTVVDEDLCASCGSCIAACPYGAVKKHPIKNKPIICDLCGGEPVCVAKCPTNALSLHPIEEVDMDRVDEVFDQAYAHALKQYKKLMELWGLDIK
ncbi:MAG: 4Fe-4S dicluster domain-containing protein [Candidatus Baldrarchaeia archaeon]